MAADQQFCLRWNNHQSTLISVFDTLLASGQLVDCTLAAEGQYLKAHKVVLSACSPYLEVLLSQHYEKHPIVILKDVKFQELKSMMDYMYRGEVNISQDQLGTFLKAAESLQIKGLSDSGGETDSRDVGSTNKRPDAPPPSRKASVPSQPRSPAVLPQSASSGLTIEPRRSMQPHVDIPPSSPLRSREGSASPTPRKRRRQRRPSQGDDNQLSSDSHLDTSNSCDLPSQAQSTPVPTIPATMTPSVPSSAASTISKPIDSDQPPLETDQLSRLGTTINSNVTLESGLIKEKMEPTSELLLEPKTEYLDEVNNEDSVEDLTLDDDDDMDASGNMDMSRPGPSHVDSNQGFSPWQHMQSGDRSATDEVFMAAQEAVGAHRDSQGHSVFSEVLLPVEFMLRQNTFLPERDNMTEEVSVFSEVLLPVEFMLEQNTFLPERDNMTEEDYPFLCHNCTMSFKTTTEFLDHNLICRSGSYVKPIILRELLPKKKYMKRKYPSILRRSTRTKKSIEKLTI